MTMFAPNPFEIATGNRVVHAETSVIWRVARAASARVVAGGTRASAALTGPVVDAVRRASSAATRRRRVVVLSSRRPLRPGKKANLWPPLSTRKRVSTAGRRTAFTTGRIAGASAFELMTGDGWPSTVWTSTAESSRRRLIVHFRPSAAMTSGAVIRVAASTAAWASVVG